MGVPIPILPTELNEMDNGTKTLQEIVMKSIRCPMRAIIDYKDAIICLI